MEVSKCDRSPDGHELIEKVVSLTGLPEPLMYLELDQILERSGQNCTDVTLDQLREAMIAYLEDLKTSFVCDESLIELE